MKSIGVINAAALFLLLGITVPAYGGQEKQEEKAKPAQQQQQAKPEKQQQTQAPKQQQQRQQQQAQAPKQHQQQAQAPKPSQQHQQQQAQAPKQQHQHQQQVTRGQQEQGQRQGGQQRQQQVSSSQRPQRTQEAQARQRAEPAVRLSARGSGRISDERFHSNFGRGHEFSIGRPVLVGGFSRFQYGGYWFGFVEPWPTDWFYTDDVYIDYVDGGYYMYNPYYPGARFAISVVI
jgi:hypothetical protein